MAMKELKKSQKAISLPSACLFHDRGIFWSSIETFLRFFHDSVAKLS